MIEGQEYIEYYVDFKDGIKYRNQPLDGYIFKFRGEFSGGEDILLLVPWSIGVICYIEVRFTVIRKILLRVIMTKY